ncbi:hypothetical protein JOD89_003889 [Priestia megaterium]|uniref:hypothetical protein n=1 Tax=Priestia megaterium TaxID=1404 RepID=UPI003D22D5B2
MHKLKWNRTDGIILLGVVLFLFSDFFRFSLFEKFNLGTVPYIKNINIIALSIIFILLIQKRIKILINWKTFFILTFISLCFISFIKGESQIYLFPLYIFNLVVPLFLLNCGYKMIDGIHLFKGFLKFYNIWICTVVVLGLIDYISGGLINSWLTHNFYSASMADLANSEYNFVYRLSTPWGTSLFNGFLVLTFLILNSIYHSIFNMNNTKLYLVYVISLIGIILIGSKACLICSLLYIMVTRMREKNKILNLVIISAILLVMFNSDFFQENIWGRILGQYETGTLSSGRDYIFSFIASGYVELPSFFIGNGAGYSRVISTNLNAMHSTATNFEYPVIMFSYDYGILATLLYYIYMFWLPLSKLLKFRNKILLISLVTLFVYLNTFNGLAELNYDFNYKYVFLIIIFYHLTKAMGKEEKQVI